DGAPGAGENGGGIADPGGDGYGGHGSEPRCVFAWQLTRSCCLAPALFVNLHRPKKGYFETVPAGAVNELVASAGVAGLQPLDQPVQLNCGVVRHRWASITGAPPGGFSLLR